MRERIYYRVTDCVEPGWELAGVSRFSNGRVALLVVREPELRDDAPAGDEGGGGEE